MRRAAGPADTLPVESMGADVFEVRLTGGYTPTIETGLTAVLGDLSEATVKGALVAEGDLWPAADSPLWLPANVTGTDTASRVVSQVVPPGTVGHFWWWLWVAAGGSTVVIQVTDPDDPDAPWLIWVH